MYLRQCGKQKLPCSGTVCAGAGVAPLLAWSRPLACPHVPEQASGLPGVHVPEQAPGLPGMHVPEQAGGLPVLHVPGQAFGLPGQPGMHVCRGRPPACWACVCRGRGHTAWQRNGQKAAQRKPQLNAKPSPLWGFPWAFNCGCHQCHLLHPPLNT